MLIAKDTPKETALRLGRMDCKGCVHCCNYGSGFLAEEDIKPIADFLRVTEKELKERFLEEAERFHTKRHRPRLIKEPKKPYGRCIFLSEDSGCTIHEVKPLHCKIGNCSHHSADLQKWFDLNYFVNLKDPESIRQYSLWLEFNEPLPGGEIEKLFPDMEKLRRILSYEVV